jgi:polar amino acid transport system permease protein
VSFDFPYFLNLVFHPPSSLLHGLWITVSVTFISMGLGIVLGTFLALAGMSKYLPFRIFNQIYIGFFRGTPMLLQIMLIYFGTPMLLGGFDLFPPSILIFNFIDLNGAILAGILTFTLHEAAAMSEIARAGIMSIDVGQSEAAKSLGMEPGLVMRRIILPQAIRVIIPPLGNQCNAMFKTTSLLSVIAVPELFLIADNLHAATYKTFEVYLGVSVYYLILTAAWSIFQHCLEIKISRGFSSRGKRSPKSLIGAQSAEEVLL